MDRRCGQQGDRHRQERVVAGGFGRVKTVAERRIQDLARGCGSDRNHTRRKQIARKTTHASAR